MLSVLKRESQLLLLLLVLQLSRDEGAGEQEHVLELSCALSPTLQFDGSRV